MPDHVHLLLRLNEFPGALPDLMRSIKGNVAVSVRRDRPSSRVWQKSYYDHILRDHEDPAGIVEYLLNNPVRSGLVEDAEQYPFQGVVDPL